MAGHLLDHFIFSSRKLSHKTKAITFGVISFLIVANFWWFRGVAFGIDGAIESHWGLLWRNVSTRFVILYASYSDQICRAGIYIIISVDGVGVDVLRRALNLASGSIEPVSDSWGCPNIESICTCLLEIDARSFQVLSAC